MGLMMLLRALCLYRRQPGPRAPRQHQGKCVGRGAELSFTQDRAQKAAALTLVCCRVQECAFEKGEQCWFSNCRELVEVNSNGDN